MNLSAKQEEALGVIRNMITAQKYGLCVIRGSAGSGKTSWLRAAANEHVLAVLAPTGKAARRVKEASGCSAQTLHSFLYKTEINEYGDLSFQTRLGTELSELLDGCNAIVVDESSMLSADLFRDVVQAAESNEMPLILMGDGYQLPPVEKNGDTFSAMSDKFIAEHADYSVDFTEVFRQAKESPILRVANAIREGGDIMPLLVSEFELLDWSSVVSLGARAVTQQDDRMTICHTNTTRHQLNQQIRAEAGFLGRMPLENEVLMVTKNNAALRLANGETVKTVSKASPLTVMPTVVNDRRTQNMQKVDLFTVELASSFGAETCVMCAQALEGTLTVNEFDVQRAAGVAVLRKGLERLPYVYANYGYAGTAHKAQGSQYDQVTMVLEPSVGLYQQDGRRWVYTGLTRAIKEFAFTVKT